MSAADTITVPLAQWEQLLTDIAGVKATLLEIREQNRRTIPDRPMSPAEIATIVGKSEKTVRRWIEKGLLRARKVGGTTLVRPVDLQRFLEGRTGHE